VQHFIYFRPNKRLS